MYLHAVIENEVFIVFISLKNSWTCAAYSITKAVNFVLNIIAPTLNDIFNMCIRDGLFLASM